MFWIYVLIGSAMHLAAFAGCVIFGVGLTETSAAIKRADDQQTVIGTRALNLVGLGTALLLLGGYVCLFAAAN